MCNARLCVRVCLFARICVLYFASVCTLCVCVCVCVCKYVYFCTCFDVRILCLCVYRSVHMSVSLDLCI